jgi:chloramphenicol-sensitive protein RarD
MGAGEFPWIAFVLAITFSVYGLLRKTTPVTAMPGLAVETLLLTPLAVGYLWWSGPTHGGVFHYSTLETVLLLCCGVVTIVPLSLFNSGARRINYTTVGMLQYIGPTMQFITGLVVFREPLSSQRLLCFVLIWSGLAVYAADTLWRRRNI